MNFMIEGHDGVGPTVSAPTNSQNVSSMERTPPPSRSSFICIPRRGLGVFGGQRGLAGVLVHAIAQIVIAGSVVDVAQCLSGDWKIAAASTRSPGWWRWSTQNESIIRNTRNVVRAIQFKVRAATTPIVRLFA
jgi:hypothetical protein